MTLAKAFLLAVCTAAPAAVLRAQGDMPGMDMSQSHPPSTQDKERMPAAMQMAPVTTLRDAVLSHDSSGTTVQPASTPMSMWMFHERGGWRFMLHGDAFLSETQQHATSTPQPLSPCPEPTPACTNPLRHGGGKLFSTNWIMPMAQRKLGPGQLTLRTMLDLEPATITHGFFPELFQQGETANGKAIIDGQHPHDFVMELAALYDVPLGERTLLSVYAAPVGDPAIGPTAYPHRMSASEDPIAALGHHQEDSTHIAFNVFTAGLTYGKFRLEGSGFHGAEPTEARWHFQPSPNGLAVDSYSTRLTFAPLRNVSAQYSIAHITAPEQLHPQEDQRRQTASVMYNKAFAGGRGNWSNTLLWGQSHSLANGSNENSYLLESLVNFKSRNYAWTRVEVAGRSSELFDLPGSSTADEQPVGHVQAYTVGYDRDYRLGTHVLAAPGAQFTLYRSPDALAGLYGRTPLGGVAFIRFRITGR